MLYQFNIHLTEEDYVAFNQFHSFESPQGKKLIRNSRMILTLVMVVLAALIFLVDGLSSFAVTYAIVLGLFTVFYVVGFQKIMNRVIRKQIKTLKKTGKLPFDPVSAFEFYEDRMAEITTSRHTEQRYDAIEQVCVVREQYLLLYTSSVGAYILPIPQLRQQGNLEELLSFLMQKCGKVAYY